MYCEPKLITVGWTSPPVDVPITNEVWIVAPAAGFVAISQMQSAGLTAKPFGACAMNCCCSFGASIAACELGLSRRPIETPVQPCPCCAVKLMMSSVWDEVLRIENTMLPGVLAGIGPFVGAGELVIASCA